jgi:nicotinamidase-related amidase
MVTALICVDVQKNMLEGDTAVPDAPSVSRELSSLLKRARAAGSPIVHVQNDGGAGDPDEPGTPGWELVCAVQIGERVVRKDQPNTFASNPDLAGWLHEQGVDTVVVAGMQSEFCVSATSLAAIDAGFTTVLASGAHATYDTERPARDIATDVERAVAVFGGLVREAADIRF